MADPEKLTKFGKAGRARAIANFSWDSIAKETVALYQSLLK
jgi:starch synthase